MYELNDTFNDKVISRHRTMDAAAKALVKHARSVKKNNGANSYIPYSLTQNGNALEDWQELEWQECKYRATYR